MYSTLDLNFREMCLLHYKQHGKMYFNYMDSRAMISSCATVSKVLGCCKKTKKKQINK